MMQRRTAQSILLMLMATTIASAALAQDNPLTPLPSLPAPGGATPPASAPAMPAPAVPTQPTPAATPAAAAPAMPGIPSSPLPTPTAAAPEAKSAEAGLPSMPATSSSDLSNVLNGLTRGPDIPENANGPKVYSYGTSSLSVLFLPTQIEKMKKAITTYESSAKATTTTFATPEPVVATGPAPVIPEPATYPVFYLASIAYDSPGQWSLWISGHKITSRKNDTDLTVVHVGPDSATFSWSPSYMAAVSARHDKKEFASVDAVKNRLLGSQPINIDQTNNAVTFTLKANQSFAAGYFRMFEGFVPAPPMPPMAAPTPAATTAAIPLDGAVSPLGQPRTAMPMPVGATSGSIRPTMPAGIRTTMPAGMAPNMQPGMQQTAPMGAAMPSNMPAALTGSTTPGMATTPAAQPSAPVRPAGLPVMPTN